MAKRPVLIRTALVEGSRLKGCVRTGLSAMQTEDARLIAEAERSKVGDSIDLDDAMIYDFPTAHRWDYVLSVQTSNQLVGVEPHAARDSEISVVIAKKKQAATFLHDHLSPRYRISKWFWVSHGGVRFSAMDRVRRLLDQNGISFEGNVLRSLG